MSTRSSSSDENVGTRLKRYASASWGSFRGRTRQIKSRRRSQSASRSNHSKQEAVYTRSQVFHGIESFEELRQIVKKGSDVSKDIAAIMAERAALELQYSKGLQKLSSKLSRMCTPRNGTTLAAWETVAEEMNVEAETHKKMGDSLMEDICKPLRNMCDIHTKVKKPIELSVDKATRSLVQCRSNELKYKIKAFQTTSEAEKIHSAIIDKRVASKKTPDKDILKLEKKLQTLKEQNRKSSKKYYICSVKSERSRQEWEITALKCMAQLQQLEEERLKESHKYIKLYKFTLENSLPQMTATCDRINEAASCIDFDKDLRKVMEARTRSESQPEQILLDVFAEDEKQKMDKERRRQALTLFLYYLKHDIDIEKKAKTGVEKLVETYSRQPNYADREALEDAKLQSRQVHAMLNFYDASHYKLSKALCSITQQELPDYKFSKYMEYTKDKTGLPQTYLRIPIHMIADGFNEADFSARGRADGGHDIEANSYETLSQDGDDFYSDNEGVEDEFSPYEYPERATHSDPSSEQSMEPICTCRVLYDFNSSQSNELTIKEGDMVNILRKHNDGWWYAELRGARGLIPESYVEVE